MEGTKKNWISSLRGLAILLVFLSHLHFFGGDDFRFILGRIGVAVFFLFSGYLSYKSRIKRTGKQYVFNRLLRMYPVYWLILGLMLLVKVIFDNEYIPVMKIIANLTLFQQFLGFDNIIGASWMMPIQVSFFLLIGVLGVSIFTSVLQIKRLRIDMKNVTILVLMAFAVIVGYVRHVTGTPFPTAYFLLMAVAFMGMYFNPEISRERGEENVFRNQIIRIFIFEFGLLISAWLSYGSQVIAYMIAYNIGIVLFLVFNGTEIEFGLLEKLSELGFAFFLCAGIPMIIIERFVDISASISLLVFGWIIKFIMALFLSKLITKYIEKPILAWGKSIEKKI